VLFAGAVWLVAGDPARVALLLPGLLAMPALTLIPRLNGDAVPLARPVDEAKSAARGLRFFFVFVGSMAIAGVAAVAHNMGWFLELLVVEAIAVTVICLALRSATRRIPWPSLE
jgi:sugar phosphate permease